MPEPTKTFLSIFLSNCLFSGTAILSNENKMDFLEKFSNSLRQITGLEFRGVSYVIVRGAHNSMNILLGGAFYQNQEWLTKVEVFKIRAALRKVLSNYTSLVFSEIRIEMVKELGQRFDE